jgi:hypothetical protein
MKTADLLSEIRSLRVFATGNATDAAVQSFSLICQGLCVEEFAGDFVATPRATVSDENAARSEQLLFSKVEARFGGSDILILYDNAAEESASCFTLPVRECLHGLICRYPGKTVWVCTPRPEIFRDAVCELSPAAAAAASLRIPGRPDLRQLCSLSKARLLVVSGSPQEMVLVQGNREDRILVSWNWSPDATIAFTVAAACALNVSGSPLLAARFGAVAATVAAASTAQYVTGTAIAAAADRGHS